ncbi:MAG: 16S rRNA (guanine(966)-N(2))-methyltransferase RsmD [Candidatus Eisenbacteria bacterium]|nr:16S rRNA (guanine(966)-N(2))-methyltransferase RsmD [Candidatus Eisenbacteria bacterium]
MRVIAGTLGGRRLAAPRGRGTRPTSDRVREALFMALEPLAGLRVVDLYAGSGALGIEALSRGAARADFVERDREARRALEQNLGALGLTDRARVWPLAVLRELARLAAALAAADLVLADPPYGGEEARAALAALGRAGVLRAGTRVVVEHHAKDAVPERAGTLSRVRERKYGETVVSTYQAAADVARAKQESER